MKPTIYVKRKFENLLSVRSIVTIHAPKLTPDYRSGAEKHNFYELVYCVSGGAVSVTGKDNILLSAGECILIKPNVIHALLGNGKTKGDVRIISFVCSSGAIKVLEGKVHKVPTALKLYVNIMFEESEAAFENGCDITGLKLKKDAPLGATQIIKSNLEQFLVRLLRANSEAKTMVFETKEGMEEHIATLIDKYLTDSVKGSLSVEALCREMGYSKSYLSGIYKKHRGDTINGRYTALKIDEAKKLLTFSGMYVSEISDTLGFADSHYFSRVFRRETGVSPKEYREKVKG